MRALPKVIGGNMAFNSSLAAAKVAAANKKMGRKFLACWALACLVYFFCLVFGDAALRISSWTAQYIPSVAKLNAPGAANNGLAGKFFGVVTPLMFAFAIFYIWGEDVLLRFRYAWPRTGRSFVETIIWVYFLGLPFIGLAFWVFYEAPFQQPAVPRLSGQHVLHLMLNTHIGLLVFGALLAALLPAFGTLALASLWLPFAALIDHFSKGTSK
jgi:hypothetical protein